MILYFNIYVIMLILEPHTSKYTITCLLVSFKAKIVFSTVLYRNIEWVIFIDDAWLLSKPPRTRNF